MGETPSSQTVSTRLQRIAERARQMPEVALTTLAHHIDIEMLREAYRRTRKDGAVGVDGQTADEYAEQLGARLASLLARFQAGTYVGPPVRRVMIPKAGGRQTRPIGIPTFEDKVLQRAVAMVLEAVYEQDFRTCSYGFRPGRSAHQALQDLQRRLMTMGGGWVYEVDIQGFFDTLNHGDLRRCLDRRVRDGVVRRTIDKWLKAGVFDRGQVTHSEVGTPQGGVLSPLLANIYLHEVLDVWFEDVVTPRLKGPAFLIRYADDVIIVCGREDDARHVATVVPKRVGHYALTLHPQKTRLQPFQRPRTHAGPTGAAGGPGAGIVRLSGPDPWLATESTRVVGRGAADGERPPESGAEARERLVSGTSARGARRATGWTPPQTAGALRVFWGHRKPGRAQAVLL